MLNTGSLGSKVGRRMTAMFVLAAIVPISLITAITFSSLDKNERDHTQQRMHLDAKLYGMILLERIQAADLILRNLDKSNSFVDLTTQGPLQRVYFQNTADGENTQEAGQLHRLPAGKDQSFILMDYRQSPAVIKLVQPLGELFAVAEINSTYLWGGIENLPGGKVLISNDQGTLFSHDSIENPGNSKTIQMASWDLYMGTYGQSSWRVSVSNVYQSKVFSQRLSINLTWILVLSLLLVAYLSLSQIRKTLRPLSTLTSNIENLRNGKFGKAQPLKSGDEFEEVADSFHVMAKDLEQNFSIQKELSQLDALILNDGGEDEKILTAARCAELILKGKDFSLALFSSHTHYDLYRKDTAQQHTRYNFPSPLPQIVEALKDIPEGRLNRDQIKEINLLFSSDSKSDSKIGEFEFAHYTAIGNKGEIYGFLLSNTSPNAEGQTTNNGKLKDVCARLAVAVSASKQQALLKERANYDVLTGLPNRHSLQRELSGFIERSKYLNTTFAVHFIDLDGFKDVNDSLGHSFGDQLLVNVAVRLQNAVDERALIARLGGDEFVVISSEKATKKLDYRKISNDLLRSIETEFLINQSKVHIGASIGVAIFPEDGENSEQLLMNADIAMYEAKKESISNAKRYSISMNESLKKRLDTVAALNKAMDENQLEWHLQPKVSAETGKIIGAEALVRWLDPQRGYIFPNEFIQAAEESGHIERLGVMAFQSACNTLIELEKSGFDNISIAVNVSLNEFRSPKFVSGIKNALDQSKVDPSLLELEITESVLAESFTQARQIISELRSLGLKVSLDDFGTGFSSLRYLHELEFDSLKIDRNFVMDIAEKMESYAITKTIVDLAHMLGKPVVAECVETPSQQAMLKRIKCDYFQGYLFSPAVALEGFIEILKQERISKPESIQSGLVNVK